MSDCNDCDLEDRVKRLEDRCEDYGQAFPHLGTGLPDIIGHRDYHERKIAAARAEEEFWRDMRFKLTEKGLTWAIPAILLLLGLGVLYLLKSKGLIVVTAAKALAVKYFA